MISIFAIIGHIGAFRLYLADRGHHHRRTKITGPVLWEVTVF